MTRGGDEQECLFQLDDGLPDLTDAEMRSAVIYLFRGPESKGTDSPK